MGAATFSVPTAWVDAGVCPEPGPVGQHGLRADFRRRQRTTPSAGSASRHRIGQGRPGIWSILIALASRTRSVLISGDKDLLDLSDRIPVYSPAQFRALIEDAFGDST
jgi:hypothetical protein